MVFSSVIFLFAFLPAVLVAYRLLPWLKARNALLLLVSLLFYFWGENYLIWIVIASTFIDYFCGLLIAGGLTPGKLVRVPKRRPHTWRQRSGLILSICSNLAFLGYFKPGFPG